MAAGDLERGRKAYALRDWGDAFEQFSRADGRRPLEAADLEHLATASYMLGRDHDHQAALERAHRAHREAGDTVGVARCAFWLALSLAFRGQMGHVAAWLARSRRQLAETTEVGVEEGYLLMLELFELEHRDWEAAADAARRAVEVGRRFDEPDLHALALHEYGHILIRHGRVGEGLRLQDEAMLVLTSGELSPIATGLVYCAVIDACREVLEPRRAREWTQALTRWCDDQPGLVAFTGVCLVHRAEIMQLHGAWGEALEEARRSALVRGTGFNRTATGLALYRQGELYRLRGEFLAAEKAYRAASRAGGETQPGLVLLRLAQGRATSAVAGIRRALSEATAPSRRLVLLPAAVEIMLATGRIEEARAASEELDRLALDYESELVEAMAAHARGAVDLAEDDAEGGLRALRRAWRLWQALEAPYESARARELVGLACRALGDEDAAEFELEAAKDALAALGATPDLTRLERLLPPTPRASAPGLTPRELEVLAHVAAGMTNRAIATELVISEKTVARHVSNIFAKLGLSTRAAATAYAYEHQLV